MKKLSLLMVAVMSALFCIAQPEIKFENSTYDFGNIKEDVAVNEWMSSFPLVKGD